ncbi:type II toxin-antitoxin system death-on-curing family toxin [Halorientalis halophila]|uniref:type II toxin-antitoxin system death-on-curing family toxin n=1 Tax=Halorientalis halophila TaxID=3108499 RepID=UPI003007F4BF
MDEDFEYLSVEDVLAVHEFIVESNGETEAGVASRGDVEYALEHVRAGQFGQGPETIHEKGYQLMRLLVANHPFVDGNKRTALASTVVLYALNGIQFDYDRRIKSFLKRLGTDESDVDSTDVIDYLDEHTAPLEAEYADTYRLWLSVIETDTEQSGRNGYDDTNATE